MSLVGRPPKPTEQKRRLGNPGNRPLPTAITVLPPADLEAEQQAHAGSDLSVDFFDALLDSGAAIWLGQTDVVAVEVARQTWVDRDKARRLWERNPGDKDLFNNYNELTKRLTSCLSLLGLDPVGRARLGVAEVRRQSTLDRLEARRGKRKDGRRAG